MLIKEVQINSNTHVALDADGITLGTEPDVFWISYRDLKDINALAEALGQSTQYTHLVKFYGGPSPHLRPFIDPEPTSQ